jgi:hypothetical protein
MQSRKSMQGDVTALCSPGASWSPRSKADAISDIESGLHTYYVDAAGYRTTVTVVKQSDGTKYLRTTADKTSRNNLANLPDC